MEERTSIEVYRSFAQKDGTGGNPAGVVKHTGLIGKDQMQDIARKAEFPETVFIERINNQTRLGIYRLLFFTPGHQISLCGHATLAAAKQLFDGPLNSNSHDVMQYERDGQMLETEIQRKDDMFFYAQPIDHHREYCDPTPVLEALELTHENVDYDFTPQATDTDILIALSEEAFDALPAAIEKRYSLLKKVLQSSELEGVHVFTLSKDNDSPIVARCRNFAPAAGIDTEEGATGSVTGFLAQQLWDQQLAIGDGATRLVFQQGKPKTPHSEIIVEQEGGKLWVGGRVENGERIKI